VRFPKRRASIRHWCNNSFLLGHFLFTTIDQLTRKFVASESVEDDIKRVGPAHRGLRSAVRTTHEIIQRAVLRCGRAKVVAFCADDSWPEYHEFKQMAYNIRFRFIDGVPQAVTRAHQGGMATYAADRGHWSPVGHRIVAERIIEDLLSFQQGR